MIFVACKSDNNANVSKSIAIAPNFEVGQKFNYQVLYDYTFNTPQKIGKTLVYYRSIDQNIQFKILQKTKSGYTAESIIKNIQIKDFDKDSSLVAQYNAKFDQMNIAYGKGFAQQVKPFIDKLDTLNLNQNSKFGQVDSFSVAPIYFDFGKNKIAINQKLKVQLISKTYAALIDSISTYNTYLKIESNNFYGKYTIDNKIGNIIDGYQNIQPINQNKYKRIVVTYFAIH